MSKGSGGITNTKQSNSSDKYSVGEFDGKVLSNGNIQMVEPNKEILVGTYDKKLGKYINKIYSEKDFKKTQEITKEFQKMIDFMGGVIPDIKVYWEPIKGGEGGHFSGRDWEIDIAPNKAIHEMESGRGGHVLFHELGHAIHYSYFPKWSNGDTEYTTDQSKDGYKKSPKEAFANVFADRMVKAYQSGVKPDMRKLIREVYDEVSKNTTLNKIDMSAWKDVKSAYETKPRNQSRVVMGKGIVVTEKPNPQYYVQNGKIKVFMEHKGDGERRGR